MVDKNYTYSNNPSVKRFFDNERNVNRFYQNMPDDSLNRSVKSVMESERADIIVAVNGLVLSEGSKYSIYQWSYAMISKVSGWLGPKTIISDSKNFILRFTKERVKEEVIKIKVNSIN